jgi:hypothetical protein
MYETRQLKDKIEIIDGLIECPVLGCTNKLAKMKKKDVHSDEDRFKCIDNGITFSGTTWYYRSWQQNILWNADILAERILGKKAESRMNHDNSEDALTWNVFRGLQYSGTLESILEEICGIKVTVQHVFYWSTSADMGEGCRLLTMARDAFEARNGQQTEPDLIIVTDKILFVIEAKFVSNNTRINLETMQPSVLERHRKKCQNYETCGNNWFNEVFANNVHAVDIRRYELMRMWLLGSWMARESNRGFCLVNLVLHGKEVVAEKAFRNQIQEIPLNLDNGRKFVRYEWEGIYSAIKGRPGTYAKRLVCYFESKSSGYSFNRSRGRLKHAFQVE